MDSRNETDSKTNQMKQNKFNSNEKKYFLRKKKIVFENFLKFF